MKMYNNIIAKIRLGVLLASASIALVGCELNAYDPMVVDDKDMTAYTLPRVAFMGLYCSTSGVGLRPADSMNLYLRPVSGGPDVNVQVKGKDITDWRLTFLVPGMSDGSDNVVSEGKYLLVLKRPGKSEQIIERTVNHAVPILDDFNRIPIEGNEILISKANVKLRGESEFSQEDVVFVEGTGMSMRDSLVFAGTKELVTFPIIANENGAYFPVPAGAKTGDMIYKSNGQTLTVIDFFKAGTAINTITDVIMPATGASGATVAIAGNGFVAGDRIVVRNMTNAIIIDAPVVTSNSISFESSAISSLVGDNLQVLLKRGTAPLFSLGYLSKSGSGSSKLIDLFGTLPTDIPSGLTAKNFVLNISASGFKVGDIIAIGANEYTPVIDGGRASVNIANKSAVGSAQVTLKRGTQSQVLGTINIVNAPRVGDYAQGGVVFWLDPTNYLKGMACNVKDAFIDTDVTKASFDKYKFGLYDKGGAVYPSTSLLTAIGSGLDNTKSILDMFGEASTAVAYCNNLEVEVDGVKYDDWFLPSLLELKEMYDNRTLIVATSKANGGHGFDVQPNNTKTTPASSPILGYMSSSAFTYSNIRYINFGNTDMTLSGAKVGNYRIRAVRVF